MNRNLTLILIALITFLSVMFLWLLTIYLLGGKSYNDRGTFGDMFGSVNALFSGLAFAGIIFTILLQREELALQRQELHETRNELKRSADAQERSENTLNNQQNQLTFFNILENQKKLLETIRLDDTLGFQGMREFATNIRKNALSYYWFEQKRDFPTFADTLKHPFNDLALNMSGIATYLKTIETIASFIEASLPNKQLFHSILYNYISVPEKYILGICYYYGKKLETNFLKSSFNYLEYYENNLEKYTNPEAHYFPGLELQPRSYKQFYETGLINIPSVLNCAILIRRNFFEKELSLNDVTLTIVDSRGEIVTANESIMNVLKIVGTMEKIDVDFDQDYRSRVVKLSHGNYHVKLQFKFGYNENEYIVSLKHLLYKLPEHSHNEEGEYFEDTRYLITEFS